MDRIWDICIDEACKSLPFDVPIGAILVKDNKVIAKAHNNREAYCDIIGHAEVNVIRKVGKLSGSWNLGGYELYVTLKPCKMCENIIKQARISKVYYLLDKLDFKKDYDKTIFEKVSVFENEQTYANILKNFFKDKR